jgi:3-deoxy-D-manno-octulosonic-acid transferase
MAEVSERRPDVQMIFTHFSPSAERLADRMPADVVDYLPWDLPSQVSPALDAIRPDLVAFTKTEVWPTLMRGADHRGIPTALIAATLPASSSRLRWPARSVLRPALARLSAVLAIATEDAERFEGLGARPGVVDVTGDPAIDSAVARLGQAASGAPYLDPFHRDPRPTLVAGSTWPADERVLLDAVASVRATCPDLRLIVAPHEPTDEHLHRLESELARHGWESARLGEVEEAGTTGGADAIVVDCVGLLARLYTAGDVAYVGGGFHGAGLHSVLEPAAAGVPTVIGPRHENARAAADLIASGAVRVGRTASELARVVQEWLESGELRDGSGRAALGYIGAHRGAAARTAERLLEIVEDPPYES